MKKKTLLIGLCLAAVAAVALALVFDLPGLLVNKAPNEAAALQIATDFVVERLSEDFLDQYEVVVMYDSGTNAWDVSWYIPNTLGGGLIVRIDKRTGDVIDIIPQK